MIVPCAGCFPLGVARSSSVGKSPISHELVSSGRTDLTSPYPGRPFPQRCSRQLSWRRQQIGRRPSRHDASRRKPAAPRRPRGRSVPRAARAAAASACRCWRSISSVGGFAARRATILPSATESRRTSPDQSPATIRPPSCVAATFITRSPKGSNWRSWLPPPPQSLTVRSRPPRDEPPVVEEVHARCAAGVGRNALDPLAVLHGPEGDRAVFAGRGQDVRIVAPTHGRHGRLMALQGLEFPVGAGLPDPDAAGRGRPWPGARRRD